MRVDNWADTTRPGVALVGAGYWGSRLARNLSGASMCSLRWVCDLDANRAAAVAGPLGARASTSLAEVLADPAVAAVVVATPARTHRDVVTACVEADRHVLVEKPLATSVDDARALAALARARGVMVMCDHTYRYAPVVRIIRTLLATGVPGAFRSAAAVRTNHNHLQPDVDVFWDLAHHDLSILTFVLPDAAGPVAVSARSADLLGIGRPHAGRLTLELGNGEVAVVQVDWCAPQKVRTMTFGGDVGELTWDDLDRSGPRLELRARDVTRRISVDDASEPLELVVEEFLAAMAEERAASCGPAEEIEVLTLLECVTRSAAAGGATVPFDAVAAEPLETSP